MRLPVLNHIWPHSSASDMRGQASQALICIPTLPRHAQKCAAWLFLAFRAATDLCMRLPVLNVTL